MQIFNRFVETTMVEILRENLQLFNAATNGAINLSYGGDAKGNWTDGSMWNTLPNLVRRRDPFGSGSIGTVTPSQKAINDARVASGTPLYKWDYAQFDWIRMNPREAAVLFAKQLAEDRFADYVSVVFGALRAALSNDSATNILDTSSESPAILNHSKLARGQQLFGDHMDKIAIWVMHSKPMTDLYLAGLDNNARLFTYGGINIHQDAFGRRILVTDNAEMVDTVPNPDTYHIYGLTKGAASIVQNDDFRQEDQAVLGGENLQHQYQAEWTFNLSLKGYSWDKSSGGPAPTNAALKINTNWDKYVTSHKDLPGIIVRVK